ncbi:MAG: M20/M25/M40 family metallo-hydrolase [Planctomycetes bacterium]|nr:M20/M25/M40 family metallo-hydrolase [Planctomycetota bacterium]
MPARFTVRSLSFIFAAMAVAAASAADQAMLEAARSSIVAADLQRHVNVLADDSFEGREAGSRGGRAAGAYLVSQLQRYGLQGAGEGGGFYQSFRGGYRNILALLPGRDGDLSNEVVLVGAHYDHVGYGTPTNSYGPTGYIHNGADDNASGVAGMLELIEAFTQLPERPRRSVLFAFWDGEEQGLLGSKHWVANPTLPLSRVRAAINLDMIGRLRNGKLVVYGTRTGYGLRRLVSEQNVARDLWLDFTWEMKANSDHYTFYEAGLPTLMFHTDLHDDYHRPRDDAHKVNSAGMEQVSRLLLNVVYAMAEDDHRFAFRPASRRETTAHEQYAERSAAPLPPRLGVWWDDRTAAGEGVVITRLTRTSAAERAGLRVGDRIVQFAGKPVESDAQLRRAILSASSPVSASIQRAGEDEPREVILDLAGTPVRLGVSWREDAAEPGSLTVTVVIPASAAADAGMRPGDRIYRIAGRTFANGEEFRALAMSLPGPVEVLLERQGRLYPVRLSVPPAHLPD